MLSQEKKKKGYHKLTLGLQKLGDFFFALMSDLNKDHGKFLLPSKIYFCNWLVNSQKLMLPPLQQVVHICHSWIYALLKIFFIRKVHKG